MPESIENKTGDVALQPQADALRFSHIAETLIHNLPLGVVVFDAQLKIVDRNPLAQKVLAQGSDIAQVLAAGDSQAVEPPWQQRLSETLNSRETATFENVPYLQSDYLYTLRIICTPLIRQDSQKLSGGVLLIEDDSYKALMQQDLASAERMAAMGKMAARVAHELNNPLDGILRYINLALRVADENQQQQAARYMRQSRKGLLRMVQIISELLEFSRSTYSAFEEADINKIVEDAVKAMEAQATDNQVEIIRHYAPDMPNVRSGNLFQVFCNLIKNAIDAMAQGGQLEVKTSTTEKKTTIQFSDTGIGLNKEAREKLFEPFFTTKETGKGTGLGLAICKDIIERYNGQLYAENRLEGGAIFTVSIPRDQAQRGPARKTK